MARCMKPDPILIHRVCAHRYLYRLFAPSTARSRDWGTVLHASTLRLPSKGTYYAADTAGTDALTHPYPWNQAWARSVTPYGPWRFREPPANGLSAPSRSLVFHHDTPVSDRSKDLFFSFRQDRWRACASSKHCSSGSRPNGGGTRLRSLRHGSTGSGRKTMLSEQCEAIYGSQVWYTPDR